MPVTRIVAVLLAGVVGVSALAWGAFALYTRDTVSTTATSTAKSLAAQQTTIAPTTADVGYTVVSPQTPGDSVAVADLHLNAPTWLIVHETRDGKPANILGAGLFFAHDTTAIVPLLRSTTAGMSYYMTAAVDNGDRVFSMKDEHVVVESGVQVWTTFEVK